MHLANTLTNDIQMNLGSLAKYLEQSIIYIEDLTQITNRKKFTLQVGLCKMCPKKKSPRPT